MWFYLALLSAFFNSLSNIARRTHGSLAQPAELAWWSLLFSTPLGLGLLLISKEPMWTNMGFILPAVIASAICSYGSVLMFKAYKYGQVSVVSPLANLIPIALVITSLIALGTVPKPLGLVGILLVVAGVYYSSVSGKHSLTHPLKQLLQNKGSRAMLLWVLLMAVATILIVIALRSASVSFMLFFIQVSELAILSVYLLCRPQKHRLEHGENVLKKWGWHIVAISTFSTLSVFFQFQAMNLADPSYVMSVKRLDVLVTVLMAGLFLRETHILKRFKGSVIAVIGVAVILIAG